MSAALRPLRPPGHDLDPRFFARSPDTVAEDLVGKVLWRDGVGGGRLVEVEAYLEQGDPASHAYRGMTPRNESMFGPPGTLYLFVSYGVHVLLNLVCLEAGSGAAVLVRALEPIGDPSHLLENRGLPTSKLRLATSGPGRIGQALSLDLGLNSQRLGPSSGVHVLDDGYRCPVDATERIGISSGGSLLLRYILPGNPHVSCAPKRGRVVRR